MGTAIIISIVGLCLGALSFIFGRAYLRNRRREELRVFGRGQGLRPITNELTDDLEHCGNLHRGKIDRFRLRDVMTGQDGGGRYFVAERRKRAHREQVLFFEMSAHCPLDRFHLEPTADGELETYWGSYPEKMMDDGVVTSLVRTLRTMGAAHAGDPEISLGVSVLGRAVVIFADEAPLLEERVAFIRSAGRLRKRLQISLAKSRQSEGGIPVRKSTDEFALENPIVEEPVESKS